MLMCGICGYINFKQKADVILLERMNSIAAYRGPDDEGYTLIGQKKALSLRGNDTVGALDALPHISEGEQNDFYIGMAHRRLSIIDLSPMGHQPMSDENTNITITFNGEIYNYIELRKELEADNYIFSTDTDTEVIIKAYQKWGEDCVNHFNGMWAFALWDAKNARLFCSRDRLGAKPFYYYREENKFIFASEIKQICQDKQIERYLNLEAVTNYIMWGLADYNEDTWIKGIYELRGGNNLSIEIDFENQNIQKFNLYDYWSLDCSIGTVEQSELYKHLERSIDWRLRSDVPVGIMLSGGLDSSCLTAVICDNYKKSKKDVKTINTFTTCFENFPEGDERNFAHKVNVFCGTNENFIYPETDDSFEAMKKMVWHYEGECAFRNLGSFLTLEQVAKSGAKVIINGQGSDETMMGYERYYAFYLKDIFKKGKKKEAVKNMKLASKNSRLSYFQMLEYYLYFTTPFIRKNRCLYRMKNYVSDSVTDRFKKNNKIYKNLFFSSLESLMENEIRGTQIPHILRYDDRGYMAYSLEGRVPFIDYKYVETAVQIPANVKIQNGYTKYLLRKYLKGKLPEDVIWRKNKMGWPSPSKKWVKNFNKEKVEQLFKNPRSRDLFDISKIKALYEKRPASRPVEVFFILEFFIEQFDVKMGKL